MSTLPTTDDSQPTSARPKVAPTSSPTSPSSRAGPDLGTSILGFLREASNPTLAACLAGLVLAVIVIFGRAGLLLIGALAGAALHAAWAGGGARLGWTKDAAGGATGFDVAKRVLDWQERRTSDMAGHEPVVPSDNRSTSELTFDQFSVSSPHTGAALTGLTAAVMRDYVSWWYAPILPAERTFIAASRDAFTAVILSVSNRLSRKRPADVFLDLIANVSSLLIVTLNELANALSSPSSPSPSVLTADAVRQYAANNPESKLASILDVKSQEKRLRDVAEDILKQHLDPSTYRCRPAYIFLREVLAGVVLKKLLESCAKPEWINGWIVHLLEDVETGPTVTANAEPTLDAHGARDASEGRPRARTADDASTQVDSRATTLGEDKTAGPKMSKAEAAMAQAIREAQKMNQLIADEDARKRLAGNEAAGSSTPDSASVDRIPTPEESETASTDLGRSLTAEDWQDSASKPIDDQAAAEVGLSESDSATKFTSFEQLVPDQTPTALRSTSPDFPPDRNETPSIHEAKVSILEDSGPVAKGANNSKSNMEYLIQIEPALPSQPGWMIARRYTDFEKLHEVIRRISVVSGVAGFQQVHSTLPAWKGRTWAALRADLEDYLHDALSHRQLAESEAMKRFLQKTGHPVRASPGLTGKGGLPTALGSVGKGMLDVLASAPKGVGGVLGNVGSLGQKRDRRTPLRTPSSRELSVNGGGDGGTKLPVPPSTEISKAGLQPSDRSNSPRSTPSKPGRASSIDLMSGQDEAIYSDSAINRKRSYTSSRTSLNVSSTAESSQPSLMVDTPQQSPLAEIADIRLPPLPTDITDDYDSTTDGSLTQPASIRTIAGIALRQPVSSSNAQLVDPKISSTMERPSTSAATSNNVQVRKSEASRLTDEETQVALDLSFAVVNELYNLSSAWNIRRTLLLAAKNFLNLDTIRVLIQDSIIDANTSDVVIAGYIRKLEESALPTEAQLKAWPLSPNDEEKGRRRARARHLLMEKGLPPALTGVMGNAASREALGKVFDCLQVEEVARGLIFGLMMQALRVISQ